METRIWVLAAEGDDSKRQARRAVGRCLQARKKLGETVLRYFFAMVKSMSQ